MAIPGTRRWRRERIRRRPFPDAWRELIWRRVPAVRGLDEADRAELEGHVQVLLAEKNFEGCGGLELSDEIRLTIAAQAAMLLLHRDSDYYPGLGSILVYPYPYEAPARMPLPGGVIAEGPQPRFGESWTSGAVVLAWSEVRAGAADPHDGQNVVLHEFAHQLDQESVPGDGTPRLAGRASYGPWARVLGAEYQRLVEDLHSGHATLIDPYGATSPAEFFAVVTELFFERPVALRARHPALYEQLRGFYQQDPAARGEGGE